MDNANVQTNTDKKKRKKKVLLAVFIPLFILGVILYIFLTHIGILQYPDWYLLHEFRSNKQYFEAIVNSDECDNFFKERNWNVEYDADKINDPEARAAVQKLVVNGAWEGFDKVCWDGEKNKLIAYRNGTPWETGYCTFFPNNPSRFNIKRIIYIKDDETLDKMSNPNLYHIEGNWYYLHDYNFKYI
ncbi:MAG: hypothetical protein K2J76_01260 [Oscillospiraceae bacterium]|nr:hypothetical protein [Oscillospiraceae bacterium]